jgi:GLPGLI family protein
MKKTLGLLSLILLLSCKTTKINTTKTKVTYKVTEVSKNSGNRFNPENLEFELIYDINQSIFQLVDKLDGSLNEMDTKITKVIYGGNIKYYKNYNINEKKFTIDQNGSTTDVITNNNEYNWEINPNDTKIIAGYKCYKATSKFERKYKGIIKETFQPYAWFTTEIPSSFGPIGLDGLPGLVLEASFDNTKVYYATSISLINTEIKKPESLKIMTYEDYSNLMYDLVSDRNDMRKQNKSNREKKTP